MNQDLKKFLKPSLPVILYIIVSIIVAVISLVTAVYYFKIGAGLFSLLTNLLGIVVISIVLTIIYNIPEDKFKYGKLIVWIIVIILLLVHMIYNVSLSANYYRLYAN